MRCRHSSEKLDLIIRNFVLREHVEDIMWSCSCWYRSYRGCFDPNVIRIHGCAGRKDIHVVTETMFLLDA
jgi:hypothetical protein